MRLRKNSILEINTAETGAILISKDKCIDEYDGEEAGYIYTISEIESYGVPYWTISHLHSFESCLDYLENTPLNPCGYNRDYLSWWLLRTPMYIDESIKHILIKRILLYKTLGEIENVIFNRKENLDDPNFENLLYWLNLASLNTNGLKNSKTSNIKYSGNLLKIEVRLEGFGSNLISSLILKANSKTTFQSILNSIYKIISNEVTAFSYEKEWILINQSTGNALKKNSAFELWMVRNLSNTIRIICKKLINR